MYNENIKKKKKIIQLFITILLFLCVILFIVEIYSITIVSLSEKKDDEKNEMLISNLMQEITNVDAILTDTNTDIDWNKLQEINPDIVGWLVIDGTNINYPILTGKNDFYLSHTYNQESNRNGSIIIKNINLFEDNEINIYGHNMKNEIMFSTLKNYMNKEFFNEHRHLYIYTSTGDYEGIIFSAYSYNVFAEEENIKELDFRNRVNYYHNNSIHSNSFELEDINKIVKLTTCAYIDPKLNPTPDRYFIIATLISI